MDKELRKSWINWREELGFTNKITGNGQKLRKSWTNGRKEAGSNNITGNGQKNSGNLGLTGEKRQDQTISQEMVKKTQEILD